MIIRTVIVGFLETNSYLVSENDTGDALLIDPGADAEKILKAVEKKKLAVKSIMLTHGHHDHVGALQDVRRKWNVPVLLHEEEAGFMNVPKAERVAYSSGNNEVVFQTLQDSDEIEMGGLKLKVLFTPGHTPGGVSFLVNNSCFTGDTLFCDGVGRTDFDGGDADKLLAGIKSKLLTLPDDMKIFPGHGPSSTIGRERRYF